MKNVKSSLLFGLVAALALVGAGCGKPAESGTPEGPKADPAAGASGATTGARKMPTAKGNTQSGDTIKIGLVASQSGELRPWGIDSINGAKLAVEEVNAAGGINGKKVELLIGDSQSKAEQGKSAAERLISEGVLGLLGEVASGITIQMGQSAFEKGIPVVAIGATKTDLTDIGANIFRVCYTDAFQGPVMATFAFEELRLRKVAIMTDLKAPYSVGLSESFRKKFEELGGQVVGEEKYEGGNTDFRGQLTKIKDLAPDGMFLSGYFNEVGPIARQARELGITVPLLGGDGWDSSEILQSGGDAIVGGFFCNHYNNREARPEVKAFLDKWKAKYGGEPGTTMGALGYDATMLMIDALKRAESLDSAALIAALENTENFASVSGAITLKGMNGNPPKRALVVELTREGQVFRKAYEADQVK